MNTEKKINKITLTLEKTDKGIEVTGQLELNGIWSNKELIKTASIMTEAAKRNIIATYQEAINDTTATNTNLN